MRKSRNASVREASGTPSPYIEPSRRQLGRATTTGWPVVLFESPVRHARTLADLRDALGGRQATVARELTKLQEDFLGGSLAEAYAAREVAAIAGISSDEAYALVREVAQETLWRSGADRGSLPVFDMSVLT